MTRISTTVDHTLRTYESSLSALIEGSILAVAVVWLFLRSWRATVISALAIPLSAIPTFAFMQWMGFTLNQITLLALSLVAGVLVDDAIVEIENIVRHMRMGKSGFQAALDAADEIGLAVVATSFTIIAVFLPVSFMGGIIGQFFRQFGLTVAVGGIHLAAGRAPHHARARRVYAAPRLHDRASRRRSAHDDVSVGPALVRRAIAGRPSWRPRVLRLSAGGSMFVLPKRFCRRRILPTRNSTSSCRRAGRLEDTARVSAEAAAMLRNSPR